MKTRAAVVDAPDEPFRVVELDIDDPREDEVLVRVAAAGLCHTDLTVRSMLPPEMFPRVFGHEGSGVVEAVGSEVDGISVGDHVVMTFRSCRSCGQCRTGGVGYCEQSMLLNYMGCRIDGSPTLRQGQRAIAGSFLGQSSFSQLALSYADNLVVVDPSVDLSTAAPFGCGFLTGAGTALNVHHLDSDSSLVVYGTGAVGIAALAAAVAIGVRTVIGVDTQEARLEQAASFGALTVNPSDLVGTTLVEHIKKMTDGGASAAIDTTAVPEVVKQAVQALAPRGRLVVVGVGAPELTLDAIDMLQNGKIVQGSIEGDCDPLRTIPELLQMHSAGRLPLDRLVARYPFEDINRAVDDVTAGRVVKPVLVF